MENATKALLIAGSVLIAIVLIAVGIKILSSTQGVTNSVEEVSDSMSKSVFNSQFTDYDGTQTGAQVRALLNKIVATYRNGSSHTVSVNNGSYKTADAIAELRALIEANGTYTVTVKYGENGYVNDVTITQKKS